MDEMCEYEMVMVMILKVIATVHICSLNTLHILVQLIPVTNLGASRYHYYPHPIAVKN